MIKTYLEWTHNSQVIEMQMSYEKEIKYLKECIDELNDQLNWFEKEYKNGTLPSKLTETT
jgi:hypothetical protein